MQEKSVNLTLGTVCDVFHFSKSHIHVQKPATNNENFKYAITPRIYGYFDTKDEIKVLLEFPGSVNISTLACEILFSAWTLN